MKTLVSVIIPTIQRADILPRALRSVLEQSLAEIEVIVVVDGPDRETENILGDISDDRVRPIYLAENQGLANARNVGIAAASSEWIALLDDDDEWHSKKLEKQHAAAVVSKYKNPLVLTKVRVQNGHSEVIWPSRLPMHGEPIGDYLFHRRRVMQGQPLMLPSSYFFSKSTAQEYPFTKEDKIHEDWSWLLQLQHSDAFGVEYLADPLTIWHAEPDRHRLSNTIDLEYDIEWAQKYRAYLSKRAYTGYLSSVAASTAAKSRPAQKLGLLVTELARSGAGLNDYISLILIYALPTGFRRSLRSFLQSFYRKSTSIE